MDSQTSQRCNIVPVFSCLYTLRTSAIHVVYTLRTLRTFADCVVCLLAPGWRMARCRFWRSPPSHTVWTRCGGWQVLSCVYLIYPVLPPRLTSSDISQTTPSPSSAHPPFIPPPLTPSIPHADTDRRLAGTAPSPPPVPSALVPQFLCECYSNTNTVRVWKYAVQTGLFVLRPSDGTCCGARVIQMSSAIVIFFPEKPKACKGIETCPGQMIIQPHQS